MGGKRLAALIKFLKRSYYFLKFDTSLIYSPALKRGPQIELNLNFFKQLIPPVLEKNPYLDNTSLAGVIIANIPNFRGHIRVSDQRVHSFYSDGYEGIRKPSKIIRISPYRYWQDLLVSIIRIFAGAVFGPSVYKGDLHSELGQGRRLTLFVSLDGTEAETLVEVDQKPLVVKVLKSVFFCC